jgi:hypothetical protein
MGKATGQMSSGMSVCSDRIYATVSGLLLPILTSREPVKIHDDVHVSGIGPATETFQMVELGGGDVGLRGDGFDEDLGRQYWKSESTCTG